MFDLIDLHTHSDHSDGTLPPRELVAAAAARKVTILALTDHDTVEGCAEAAAACREAGIGYVPGAELTAGWQGQEIHVVGLGLDPADAALRAFLGDVVRRRRERIAAIGVRLARDPHCASLDVAAGVLSRHAVPTRSHVARALCAAGVADTVQQAFDRYLGRGRAGHVPADWPELATVAAAIRAAGGIAVLAHPHRYKLSAGGLRRLCDAFKAAGGEAMEVSLPALSPNDADRLARLARACELMGSAGSDFHEPGLPWRPLGRFAKLPDRIEPLLSRLRPL